jgi:hypothetical protein
VPRPRHDCHRKFRNFPSVLFDKMRHARVWGEVEKPSDEEPPQSVTVSISKTVLPLATKGLYRPQSVLAGDVERRPCEG